MSRPGIEPVTSRSGIVDSFDIRQALSHLKKTSFDGYVLKCLLPKCLLPERLLPKCLLFQNVLKTLTYIYLLLVKVDVLGIDILGQ